MSWPLIPAEFDPGYLFGSLWLLMVSWVFAALCLTKFEASNRLRHLTKNISKWLTPPASQHLEHLSHRQDSCLLPHTAYWRAFTESEIEKEYHAYSAIYVPDVGAAFSGAQYQVGPFPIGKAYKKK